MACSFFLGCRVFVFTFDQSLIATTRRWSLPTGPGVVYLCPWTAPAWPGVTDEELTRNMWPQMPAIKPVASHQAYGMSLINVYLIVFLGWHIDNLSLQSEIFFGGCCMMCMAMRFFSWASSTQTLMLEMLETYRILVGWRAMVSRRRRKLKGSSKLLN